MSVVASFLFKPRYHHPHYSDGRDLRGAKHILQKIDRLLEPCTDGPLAIVCVQFETIMIDPHLELQYGLIWSAGSPTSPLLMTYWPAASNAAASYRIPEKGDMYMRYIARLSVHPACFLTVNWLALLTATACTWRVFNSGVGHHRSAVASCPSLKLRTCIQTPQDN